MPEVKYLETLISAAQIEEKVTELARQIDAIGDKYNADLVAQATTMDISMMTGSGITVEITGDDIEELQRIARDVAELARGTEGVVDLYGNVLVPFGDYLGLEVSVDGTVALGQTEDGFTVYRF